VRWGIAAASSLYDSWAVLRAGASHAVREGGAMGGEIGLLGA
jgi:hypothetical protein